MHHSNATHIEATLSTIYNDTKLHTFSLERRHVIFKLLLDAEEHRYDEEAPSLVSFVRGQNFQPCLYSRNGKVPPS